MIKPTFFSFLILFVILIITGCSSTKSTPVIPENPQADINLPATELNTSESSRSILGTWTLSINHETLEATVEPDRTLNAHHNVTGMIPDPLITINSWDPIEEIADVDIQIHNNTWISVYDVRLIIYTDVAGHTLINADNWTPLWDIPGGQIANPFKAYAKHEINRAYTGLMWHQENFRIKCPGSNYSVQFAIDVSYPGNCEEPYEISNFQQGILYDDIGADAVVTVDVFDWQNDVSEVYLHCPQITDEPQTPFEYDVLNRWILNLINNTGALEGEYIGYLIARSANSSALALYDRVSIIVTTGTGGPDIQPPIWDSTVGIERAVPRSEEVVVVWGIATDELSPPVEYLLYIDTDYNPWDQVPVIHIDNSPYTVTGLENGREYWFGVRCRDNASPPNIDTNIVVLSAIPDSGLPIDPVIIGSYEKAIYTPYDLAFSGDFAFVADAGGPVKSLDISDPYSIEITGEVGVTGTRNIDVDEEYAYAVSWDNPTDTWEMSVIDISDPTDMLTLGSLQGSGRPFDISASNGIVCISGELDDTYYGFMTIDASIPSNPQIKSFFHFDYCGSLEVSGNYVYLACYQDGLRIYDISNPEAPQFISSLITGNNCTNVELTPGFAFIMGGWDRHGYVAVINISNPRNPFVVDEASFLSYTMNLSVSMYDITIGDDLLYVGWNDAYDDVLSIYDISNPGDIEYKGGFEGHPLYGWSPIKAYRDFMYCLTSSGLKIIDVRNPVNPEIAGEFNGYDAHRIRTAGSYAYTIDIFDQTLSIFDISDQFHPHYVNDISFGSGGSTYWYIGMDIADDKVYIADPATGLLIIDITYPVNPVIISFLSLSEYATQIIVKGDYAYIVLRDYGMAIVDISDPYNPELIETYLLDGLTHIDIKDNLVYLIHEQDYHDGLHVVDISDPPNPQLLGMVEGLLSPNAIGIYNDYCFIGSTNTLYWTVDISDPANPVILSEYSGRSYCRYIEPVFPYAFFGSSRFQVMDISTPEWPTLVNEINIDSSDIEINDNIAYLACGEDGFKILELW